MQKTVESKMAVHYSSGSDDWTTPKELFDELDKEFSFNLDVAASDTNNLCENYFSVENSALSQPWRRKNQDIICAWCNPPYSRGQAKEFIRKALEEISLGNVRHAVFLLPARTDTILWHEVIFPKASEIRFLRGRLKFSNSPNSAPFPSAIVVFERNYTCQQTIIGWDYKNGKS